MAVVTSEHPHVGPHAHQHSHHFHHHQQQQHQQQLQAPHPQRPHSMQAPHRDHHNMHVHGDVHGLRLALGSILSPKRLSTPSSRTSSGTASPCPAHFGPGLIHSYQPHSSHLHTPSESQDVHHTLSPLATSETIQQLHPDSQHLAHKHQRPTKSLSRSNSTSSKDEIVLASAATEHVGETHSESEVPVILTTSNVHGLSQSQTQTLRGTHEKGVQDLSKPMRGRRLMEFEERKHHENGDGFLAPAPTPVSATERDMVAITRGTGAGTGSGVNAYIETLKSKRAFDALVHGNML